jgi:hypothetical protein
MSELVTDCPRCGSNKTTFDLVAAHLSHVEYRWQRWFEAFCICLNCSKTAVFVLSQTSIEDAERIKENGLPGLKGSVNNYMQVEGFISLKNFSRADPPDHLPADILNAFNEGATCMAVNCFNAAGTSALH